MFYCRLPDFQLRRNKRNYACPRQHAIAPATDAARNRDWRDLEQVVKLGRGLKDSTRAFQYVLQTICKTERPRIAGPLLFNP